jgi:O-acetyl-ADP-ribose deacetylase (regulator of RNase III)
MHLSQCQTCLSSRKILEDRCDALVSPANSFGFMDGGIDLAYLRHFGTELESRVQAKIRTDFHGELPVVVVAPTMRIPDRIGNTPKVYLAFRAALLAVLAHNASASIAIQSLRSPVPGTGVGAIPLTRAARQMHAAYVSVFESPKWLTDPAAILVQHEDLRSA